MHALLLNLHILGAVIWAGGHLVLALVILPRAFRTGEIRVVRDFEHGYERFGLSALLVQVITGPLLAARWVPNPADWLPGHGTLSAHIFAKLFLLALTVLLALHGKLRMMKKVGRGEWGLKAMTWHIVPVTVLSVLFLVLGVSIRLGG